MYIYKSYIIILLLNLIIKIILGDEIVIDYISLNNNSEIGYKVGAYDWLIQSFGGGLERPVEGTVLWSNEAIISLKVICLSKLPTLWEYDKTLKDVKILKWRRPHENYTFRSVIEFKIEHFYYGSRSNGEEVNLHCVEAKGKDLKRINFYNHFIYISGRRNYRRIITKIFDDSKFLIPDWNRHCNNKMAYYKSHSKDWRVIQIFCETDFNPVYKECENQDECQIHLYKKFPGCLLQLAESGMSSHLPFSQMINYQNPGLLFCQNSNFPNLTRTVLVLPIANKICIDGMESNDINVPNQLRIEVIPLDASLGWNIKCLGLKFLFSYGYQIEVSIEDEIVKDLKINEQIEDKFLVLSSIFKFGANQTFENGLVLQVSCKAPVYNSEKWVSAFKTVEIEPKNDLIPENFENYYVNCSNSEIPAYKNETNMKYCLNVSPNLKEEILNCSIFEYINETLNSEPEESNEDNVPVIIGISLGSAFFIFLILLAIFGILKYFRLKNFVNKFFTKKELDEFFKGDPEKFRRNETDNYKYASYNKSVEISEKNLEIFRDKVLGSGQHGICYKGKLILEDEEELTVAVKTTKETDKDQLKTMLSEIKIMLAIGNHENVVKFMGAITNNLRNGFLFIVVEFCDFGGLDNYLRNNKINFYENIGDENQISLTNLINWSYEAANGMAFLESRNIIHADLAARNVLLTKERKVRITDFGLSRKLYSHNIYVKTTKEAMPWRWMAIESLKDLKFSSKSDVWAYGILLWEIFTLGDMPFRFEILGQKFLDNLSTGLRPEKPKLAPDFIFNLMGKSWAYNQEMRPSFEEIKNCLYEHSNKRQNNDYTVIDKN